MHRQIIQFTIPDLKMLVSTSIRVVSSASTSQFLVLQLRNISHPVSLVTGTHAWSSKTRTPPVQRYMMRFDEAQWWLRSTSGNLTQLP